MPATRTCRRILPVRLTDATVLRRPVCCCEILPRGIAGLATINNAVYGLEYNATLPEEGEPIVHGYRLVNTTNGQRYDVDAALSGCSCPDFLFRRGRAEGDDCKHILAVRQWREDGDLA